MRMRWKRGFLRCAGLALIFASGASGFETAAFDGAGPASCTGEAETRCDSSKNLHGWRGAERYPHYQIRVSTAKYGAADSWCSGLEWVARICNGRGACVISLPDPETQWSSQKDGLQMRDQLVCGARSKVTKFMYVGWYCGDGAVAMEQPGVAIRDGGYAVLSCRGLEGRAPMK